MARRAVPGAIGWAAAGALPALSLLGAASIGLFVLPVAVAALAVLATRAVPGLPAIAAGAGLLVLALGLADALDGIPQCTAAGVADGPGATAPSRCESGGIPAWLMLTSGAALVLASLTTLLKGSDPFARVQKGV